VHRFTIGKQDDSEIALFLRNERPPLHTTIWLNAFGDRTVNHTLYPRFTNSRSIGPLTRMSKVRCGFQDTPSPVMRPVTPGRRRED